MILRKIFLFVFVISLFSCATVVPPAGGDKDTYPPILLKSLPSNKITNIFPEKITLIFNENIVLHNAKNTIIFSPNLKINPKISVKKNKLFIYLDNDSLKPNTTYNVSFINSISDLNEGNTVNNLNYVFSTGSFIDSFSLNCICINSIKNNPIPNCTGVLINNEYQSEYRAISSPSGNININNISKGVYDFYIFADANKNNIADTKEFYFYKRITIDSLSNTDLKKTYLFPKRPSDSLPLKLVKANIINPFLVSLKFSRFFNNKDNILYSLNSFEYKKDKDLIATSEKDSFLLYHSSIFSDTLKLKIKINNVFDSVNIKQPHLKKTSSLSLNLNSPIIPYSFPVIFSSSSPIKLINSKKILINDSLLKTDVELINHSKILINEINSLPAQIIFKQGSLTDYDGNSDFTDTFSVSLANNESTGNISFIVSDSSFIRGKLIITVSNQNFKYKIISKPDSLIKISSLLPGFYDIEIILDENNNGIADDENFINGTFPERIIKFENFFNIKANWDVENVNINLN